MKCLSRELCAEWVSTLGGVLEKSPRFTPSHEELVVRTRLPTTARSLSYFANAIIDWLPVKQERLFMLTDWGSHPPAESAFISLLRRCEGYKESIQESPGHVFRAGLPYRLGDDNEARDLEHDEVIIRTMILLVICFGDEGILLADSSKNRVTLGDGLVTFHSMPETHESTKRLVQSFAR